MGEGRGVEGLSKKEKGPMDMDNSVVAAGGGGYRRLNGNGKNIIMIKLEKRMITFSLSTYV